ncbi:hypothetical protein N9L68_08430 [bacterium]|nr:hypothetical protein [bacterium]
MVTRLGERYFRDRPSEYIISIPARFNIIRGRDKADIEYRGYMPVTSLNARLRGIVGEVSARAGGDPGVLTRLRQGVLNEVMRYRDQDGHVAVHSESDVTAWYNPDTPRGWRYSEMRTTIEDNGYADQQAFLDRPMRSPKSSSLINVAGVIPEAYEELTPGVNCAIDQLSKFLDLPYDDIEAAMALISSGFYGHATVTPRVLIEWCEQQNLLLLFCNESITYKMESHNPIVKLSPSHGPITIVTYTNPHGGVNMRIRSPCDP